MNAPAPRLIPAILLGMFLAFGLPGCGASDDAGDHSYGGSSQNNGGNSAGDAGGHTFDAVGSNNASIADASEGHDASDHSDASVEPDDAPQIQAPDDDTIGAPCASDRDCPSGHCASVGGQLRGVCTTACDDASGCPSGWSCETVYAADGKFCTCESSDEVCDGLDNDCDGLVDEGQSDTLCGGEGLCADAACMCPAEFSCQGGCRDLFTDAQHCGRCDRPCDVACSAGSCAQAVSVSVGADHICVVLDDGRLRCAGDNTHGQLGDGSTTATDRPVDVLWMDKTRKVAAADHFSCALDERGDIYCWGSNRQGQVADPPHTERHRPTRWTQISQAVDLDTRHYTGCAVTADGKVHCWGPHGYPRPTVVEGLDHATHVAVGDFHRCALIAAGQVACWGDNSSGQIGDESDPGRQTIQPIPMLSDAIQIVAGEEHTCVRQSSGAVKCFGSNSESQLGDDLDVATNSTTPVRVDELGPAADITAGSRHNCALTEDDASVFCWGANGQGQLGDGSTSESTRPVEVRGLPAAQSIDAGDQTTCALTVDGQVYCWGARFGVNPRKIRW